MSSAVQAGDLTLELLDSCATDLDVVNAARVSFAQESDWVFDTWTDPETRREWDIPGSQHLNERDRGLVSFLLKNRHGTPFEHGFFKFRVSAPIFVFREWHRHRVGHSYNEMSGRYVELAPEFYIPESFRVQVGKPGAYTYEDMPPGEETDELLDVMVDSYEESWQAYETLLGAGVAKEQARAVLPVGIFSTMIWSCNPRSLMHFVGLRNSPHAQKEIRLLAAMAEDVLAETMPHTHQAFVANGRTAP